MTATGIVRRIDDLGRVVIPRDIRRTNEIKEDDEFEFFLGEDGCICLVPYNITKNNTFNQLKKRFENCEDDFGIKLLDLLAERLTNLENCIGK